MNSARKGASGSATSCARAQSAESSKVIGARIAPEPLQRSAGAQAIEDGGRQAHRLDQRARPLFTKREGIIASYRDPFVPEGGQHELQRPARVNQGIDVDGIEILRRRIWIIDR